MIADLAGLSSGTSAVGSLRTVAHTLGVTPQLVLLIPFDPPTDQAYGLPTYPHFGVTLGPSKNAAAAARLTLGSSARVQRADACGVRIAASGLSTAGRLHLQSWDANNLTFVIDEVFATNVVFGCLVLAGLTDVDLQWVNPGTAAIDFGFQPDAVIAFSARRGGGLAPAYNARLCIGAATPTDQASLGMYVYGAASPPVASYQRRGRLYTSVQNESALGDYCAVSAFTATGITLNWTHNNQEEVYFLALKGCAATLAQVLTQTDTSTYFDVTTPTQLRAALLFSHQHAESSDLTPQANAGWQTGFVVGVDTNEWTSAVWHTGTGGARANRVWTGWVGLTDTPGQDAIMNAVAIEETRTRFRMYDADASQRQLMALILGNPLAGTVVGSGAAMAAQAVATGQGQYGTITGGAYYRWRRAASS